MSTKFENAVEVVLKHEGGYVDHPSDPGGATNYGISLRFALDRGTMLDQDGDGDVDKTDIRLLTRDSAKMVYREVFWRAIRGDELPTGVDLALFDFAVNSGPARAIRYMQKVLGIQEDGVFGPQTMAAVKIENATTLVQRLCDARMVFLRNLGTWDTFGRGWTARVEDVRHKAMVLVGTPMTTVTEAVQTDTVKAAAGMAMIGTAATAITTMAPAIDVLAKAGPFIGVALIVAATVCFVVWRMRRA